MRTSSCLCCKYRDIWYPKEIYHLDIFPIFHVFLNDRRNSTSKFKQNKLLFFFCFPPPPQKLTIWILFQMHSVYLWRILTFKKLRFSAVLNRTHLLFISWRSVVWNCARCFHSLPLLVLSCFWILYWSCGHCLPQDSGILRNLITVCMLILT